ncbi:hypothetical protein MUK42_15648 [Musa troglodytarum]|uniref:Uncharacterized protein n=1 Tax=Musa troglodytarum TaxID=320322 RepID=A0A9E7F7G5_9LILI|nr:hypothetical protein MUK42_15648 [Musa troglodytarum]
MWQKEGKSMDQPHHLLPVGTTRSPQGCLRHPGVTDRPWVVRVGEGQSLILKTSILKTKEWGGKKGWILRNHKNP